MVIQITLSCYFSIKIGIINGEYYWGNVVNTTLRVGDNRASMAQGIEHILNPEGHLSDGWSGLAMPSIHMAKKRGSCSERGLDNPCRKPFGIFL